MAKIPAIIAKKAVNPPFVTKELAADEGVSLVAAAVDDEELEDDEPDAEALGVEAPDALPEAVPVAVPVVVAAPDPEAAPEDAPLAPEEGIAIERESVVVAEPVGRRVVEAIGEEKNSEAGTLYMLGREKNSYH